jgi:hypothetical protein
MAEQNLLSVIDAIEKAGYYGVGGFLDALMVSQDGSMKRRVSTLVENQMSNIVMKLLQHARFGRQTERNQPLGVRDVANPSGSNPAGNIKTPLRRGWRVSRTVRDMLLGAASATAGLWMMFTTVALLHY